MASNVINIREFVDVSTAVASSPTNVSRDWSAVLFVQKGTDAQATVITKYDDLAAVIAAVGSNTEAAKFAAQLYGTSYDGISLNAPLYVAEIGAADADEFIENFMALLGDERFYYIALDTLFTDAMKKSAVSLNEANQSGVSHKLFVDDLSPLAFNSTLAADLGNGANASISAFCAGAKCKQCMVAAVNPSNTNKYYSAGMIAYFATREFAATSRCMATIAHKPASGISPIDFTDSGITVSPDDAWKNLDEKHANAYINVKLVGLSAWERGNTPAGDDVTAYISADYLNYTISVSVFQLLQSVPRLAMNENGASLLANTLDGAFNKLYNAGIIGPGVSLDGESFGGRGYHYSIPTPTGVKRANGLWDGIYCSALLQSSAKKVVIGNVLKK